MSRTAVKISYSLSCAAATVASRTKTGPVRSAWPVSTGFTGTQMKYSARCWASTRRTTSKSSFVETFLLANTSTRLALPVGTVGSDLAGPRRHLGTKYSTKTTTQDSRPSHNSVRARGSSAIDTSRPTIPTRVRTDRPGKNHILTRKLFDGVRRRNTIWESAIIRYTESTREPDDFSRNTNTAPGAPQAMITHKRPPCRAPRVDPL